MTPRGGSGRAWKALAVFWLLVLAGGAGTVLVLNRMGPPPGPVASAVAPPGGMPPVVGGTPRDARVPNAVAPDAARPDAAGSATAPVGNAPVGNAPVGNAPVGNAPVGGNSAAPGANGSSAGGSSAGGLPDAPLPPPLSEPGMSAAGHRPIPPPEPGLQEASPYGPVPRIGDDGRHPSLVYAHQASPVSARPRIALVIGGFGPSPSRSQEAIRRLPAEVTLGFSPLAARPERLLEQSRARGMEVLLALPGDGASPDSAGLVLRPGLSPAEASDRLVQSLARFPGYIGVLGPALPRTGRGPLAATLQVQVRQRGLLYVDPQPGAPQPEEAWGRSADLALDEPLTRGEVERRLAELEALAQRHGDAIGIASDPAPLLVDRILAWAAGLAERGLDLVPVSALAAPPAAQSSQSGTPQGGGANPPVAAPPPAVR